MNRSRGLSEPSGTDILAMNRKAWDAIGERTASPYMGSKAYLRLFNRFCDSLPPKARVLDAGCGPGVPVTRELVRRGFRVTAVDISGTMVALIKKNVPEAEAIRLSMTDIRGSEAFDGVVSSYSLLCLNPERARDALARIRRALKPNGILFLALNEPAKPPEEYTHGETILGQAMYTRGYTEAELREMAAGMAVVDIARDTVTSEAYGTEHTLVMLMRR